jgi:hypothetical protein
MQIYNLFPYGTSTGEFVQFHTLLLRRSRLAAGAIYINVCIYIYIIYILLCMFIYKFTHTYIICIYIYTYIHVSCAGHVWLQRLSNPVKECYKQ